jgi:hypothetical protein
MLQQLFSVYHRFAQWTARSASARLPVSLNVVALEERATPTATPALVPLVAPPQAVLVAPIVTAAPVSGSLAIPMAGQSMVRLDLIAPGESAQTESADDAAEFLGRHWREADAPLPVAQSNADDLAVSEEELAEMLAASPEA